MNVEDNKKEVLVSAELPGVDEKDIDVTVTEDTVTIQGETKQEKEEKETNYFRQERTYGSFARTIGLPAEIDKDKAEAVFKKGVLTLTLPKTQRAQEAAKKLTVKAA